MDLTTIAIIAIVVLVSFLSMLFISRFPKGKTFEEMLKEKREMREKILGLTAATSSSSSSSKPGKESANKKTKKAHSGGGTTTGQKGRSAKQQQQQQTQRVEVVERESDGNSSESQLEEDINPLAFGAKKRTGLGTNLTVEYAETEAFPLSDNTTAAATKKKHAKQQQQQQGGKKGTQKGGSSGGILLNKAEPVLVKPVESVPEMNHFAEIQPKDALEIARLQKQEEEAKAGKQHQPKEQRQGKGKKEHNPKMSPKSQGNEQQPNAGAPAPPVVVEMKKHEGKAATGGGAMAQKENKANKKKRNELLSQELAAEVADGVNVQSVVNILSTAELPRNDIQILIDFLLNKQQDTLAKDPSEWNDPSDPLQKLKRQLQEKEAALQEEQQAAAGLQAKLKELRQELNGEKVQASGVLKSYVEELNNRKQEVHHLTQELTVFKDKMANEKHALTMQCQQLQAKYIQLSKEHAATQDHGSTIAQLNNDLQRLQQELMAKSQLLNEKLQSEEDLLKKKTEYEILLHSKDELMRQRVQDLAAYEGQLHQLQLQVGQKEELDKSCQQQSYAIEQLKVELQAKQKDAVNAAAASNQADEMNRVEIRNLQNALDSTKSKLEAFRKELVDCKSLLTDYTQQTNELKAKEELLLKQLEEQRQRNDNLRTKNWKLVEALQNAERRNGVGPKATESNGEQQQKLAASISQAAEKVDVGKVVLEEQNRTKDLLVQLLLPTGVVPTLPVDATDFQSWLEATVRCIKEQHELLLRNHSSASSSTVGTNSTTAVASQTTTTTSSSGISSSAGVNNNNADTASSRISSSSSSSSNMIANNNLIPHSNVNNSLQSNNNNNDAHGATADGAGESANKNGGTESGGEEDDHQSVAVRNEQLQKTVDQYKIIIADTEIMLKNLEARVIEQDIHWRSVVQAKDKELNLLKSAGAVVQ